MKRSELPPNIRETAHVAGIEAALREIGFSQKWAKPMATAAWRAFLELERGRPVETTASGEALK